MKKVIVFLSLAAIALVSCQKEASLKDEASPKATRTFKCVIASEDDIATAVNIDSRVAIAADGKTTWEVGDQIRIHTGHIRDGEVAIVTLAAEDISADGKTATITFEDLKLYDYEGNGFGTGYSKYYAAYPASAASASPGSCYNKVYFSDTNAPLMAAYSDDENDTFVFFNLCGIIRFSVSGDFDNYVFSGNADESVGYGSFAAEMHPSGCKLAKVMDNPKAAVAGDIDSPDGVTVYSVCLPHGAEFSSGFTFKFKDGDEIIKVAINNKPVTIGVGQILDLGDITSKLVDYVAPSESDHKSEIPIEGAVDLSGTYGPANCYVISSPGIYKFPAVKGNSDTSAGNVFGADLMWETFDTSTAISVNTIISAVDFEDNWIYFQTPSPLVPGNALIAARNFEDEIIWSWHIWVPETAITTSTFGVTNTQMMDRNLGALRITLGGENYSDPESMGMLYQWGRKDPFLHPSSIGGNIPAASTGSFEPINGQITIAESIKAPMSYVITGGDSIKDWTTESSTSLWSLDKTIYDPCPPGYVIPTRDKSTSFWNPDATPLGWAADAIYRWYRVGVEFDEANPSTTGYTYFPMAGYLDQGSYYTGTRAYLWSSYCSSTDIAYQVYVNGESRSVTEQRKSRAGYIRCVEE